MHTLKGDKVFAKAVEKSDLAKRVDWINDQDVQATLNFDTPVSLAKTEHWFGRAIAEPSRRDFSLFSLDQQYIGFGGLIGIDFKARKAELYVAIGDTEFWRGGYGTDAYKIIVNYGFKELGLQRIYGYQLPHNAGAHRVVEKLGWKREGLLRQDLWSHGVLTDRYIVAILRNEWEALPNVYRRQSNE